MALLTLIQQNSIKPISQNWANQVKVSGGSTNFVQLQKEIENVKYKKMIGAAILLDIQTNPATAPNAVLLAGATFEDCDGNDIKFEGILYQLAYLNYAKYVGISDHADTFTGMVRQNRTETTFLSEGAIKREQHDAEEAAQTDFEIMRQYIIKNIDSYPLWNTGKTSKISTPKWTTHRKTYY